MVARGQNQVMTSGDPTAHAVVVVVREAARRLGRSDLRGVVVFTAVEPCAMCVGALLESNIDGLVFACPDAASGAAGSAVQLPPARGCRAGWRLSRGSCSARRSRSAMPPDRRSELLPRAPDRHARLTSPGASPARQKLSSRMSAQARLVSSRPRRGVRVVDGAALEKRCAKAPWVRIPPSPPDATQHGHQHHFAGEVA